MKAGSVRLVLTGMPTKGNAAMRRSLGLGLGLLLLPLLTAGAEEGHPKDPRVVDRKAAALAKEFRPVEGLVSTRVSRAAILQVAQPGYLGIHVESGKAGRLNIVAVEPKSPADQGGVKPSDVLLQLGGHTMTDTEQVGSFLRGLAAGETLILQIERDGKEQLLRCTMGATSRLNNSDGPTRVGLGFRTRDAQDRVRVISVQPDTSAATAGVKEGDLVIQVDGKKIAQSLDLNEAVSNKQPGQTVSLILQRDGKELGLAVQLVNTALGERQ